MSFRHCHFAIGSNCSFGGSVCSLWVISTSYFEWLDWLLWKISYCFAGVATERGVHWFDYIVLTHIFIGYLRLVTISHITLVLHSVLFVLTRLTKASHVLPQFKCWQPWCCSFCKVPRLPLRKNQNRHVWWHYQNAHWGYSCGLVYIRSMCEEIRIYTARWWRGHGYLHLHQKGNAWHCQALGGNAFIYTQSNYEHIRLITLPNGEGVIAICVQPRKDLCTYERNYLTVVIHVWLLWHSSTEFRYMNKTIHIFHRILVNHFCHWPGLHTQLQFSRLNGWPKLSCDALYWTMRNVVVRIGVHETVP